MMSNDSAVLLLIAELQRDRAALRDEVDRLSTENAALRQRQTNEPPAD